MRKYLNLLIALVLTACATPITQQQITTAAGIISAGLSSYGAVKSKNPAAIATAFSNDLYALSAAAAANPTLTPAAADLSQYAGDSASVAKLVALLPAVPMGKTNLPALFATAAKQLTNPATVAALTMPVTSN